MSLPNDFPPEFRSPKLSPVMQAGLEDIFLHDHRDYGLVPLVVDAVKPNVIGEAIPKSALLLGIEPNENTIRLDSVSVEGVNTEDLARLARDLIEPLEQQVMVDLGSIILKTAGAGYPVLSGVISMEKPDSHTEFFSLIVPSIYQFGVFDTIDMSLEHNKPMSTTSREEVSTILSAAILSWSIENSIQV